MRVTQGLEPPAFLNLFQGRMVIHRGSRKDAKRQNSPAYRLFTVMGGPFPEETCLLECSEATPDPSALLRTQGVYLFVCTKNNTITIWRGAKSLRAQKEQARFSAREISVRRPADLRFSSREKIDIVENDEGQESMEFFRLLNPQTLTAVKFLKPTDDYNLEANG